MRCRIVLQTPSDKEYKKDDVHVVHRNRTVDLKSASATTTSYGLSYLLLYKFNMVRTQFTLNEVAICFASHMLALITSKSLCLLPSKVYARFQEQRTLLVRPVFLQENDEFKNEGKNSNTALNYGQQVETFLYAWRFSDRSCTGYWVSYQLSVSVS